MPRPSTGFPPIAAAGRTRADSGLVARPGVAAATAVLRAAAECVLAHHGRAVRRRTRPALCGAHAHTCASRGSHCGTSVTRRCAPAVSIRRSISRRSSRTTSQFFCGASVNRLVCLNGGTAARLYAKLVVPRLAVRSRACAYGTTAVDEPAHAALRFEQKLERWRAACIGLGSTRLGPGEPLPVECDDRVTRVPHHFVRRVREPDELQLFGATVPSRMSVSLHELHQAAPEFGAHRDQRKSFDLVRSGSA